MTAARVRGWALLAGVCLLGGAPGALARGRVTCVTIRTDETVASVARGSRAMRGTCGRRGSRSSTRRRPGRCPRPRYGFLFAGWNACTTADDALPEATIEPVAQVVGRVPPPVPARRRAVPSRRPWPAVVVWAPAAVWSLVVLGLALTYWLVDVHLPGARPRCA